VICLDRRDAFNAFIAALLLFCLLLVSVAYMLAQPLTIPSSGNVYTVGVDADVDRVDWGNVEPGSTVTRTVRFTPEGSVPVTIAVNTTNYIPGEMLRYSRLDDNYTGAVLVPGEWLPVEFALTVFGNVTGVSAFSFDMVVWSFD